MRLSHFFRSRKSTAAIWHARLRVIDVVAPAPRAGPLNGHPARTIFRRSATDSRRLKPCEATPLSRPDGGRFGQLCSI